MHQVQLHQTPPNPLLYGHVHVVAKGTPRGNLYPVIQSMYSQVFCHGGGHILRVFYRCYIFPLSVIGCLVKLTFQFSFGIENSLWTKCDWSVGNYKGWSILDKVIVKILLSHNFLCFRWCSPHGHGDNCRYNSIQYSTNAQRLFNAYLRIFFVGHWLKYF